MAQFSGINAYEFNTLGNVLIFHTREGCKKYLWENIFFFTKYRRTWTEAGAAVRGTGVTLLLKNSISPSLNCTNIERYFILIAIVYTNSPIKLPHSVDRGLRVKKKGPEDITWPVLGRVSATLFYRKDITKGIRKVFKGSHWVRERIFRKWLISECLINCKIKFTKGSIRIYVHSEK